MCLYLTVYPTFASQLKYNCPALPRDSKVLKVTDAVLQSGADAQGKTPYKPGLVDSPQTGKMRRLFRAMNGVSFGYRQRPAEYLLVRQPAPNNPFAIDIDSNTDPAFSCFARRGDMIELRNGPAAVRWTSLYNIDFTTDRVELLDQWPDNFPVLTSSSGTQYHGKIQKRGNVELVVLSVEEFESSVLAILTVDEPTFALALISPACRCLSTTSAKYALANTLLTESRKDSWSAALNVVESWPKSDTGEATRVAYVTASTYIAGAYGLIGANKKEESITRFTSLFRSSDPSTMFDPLLPAVKLRLLGSVDDFENPVTGSILAASERDQAAKKFSDFERAEFLFFKARLQLRSNNKAAATKTFNDAVTLLTEVQKSATTDIREFSVQSPENIIAQDDLNSTLEMSGHAHKALVELYISANRPIEAGENFRTLLEGLTTPIPDLIFLFARACSMFNDPAGLRASDALQPSMPKAQVLAGLRSTTCFQNRPVPKSSCAGPECSQKLSWAKGQWFLFDSVVDGDCTENGPTHLELILDGGADPGGYAGTFEAHHSGTDSCYPVVQDRFLCVAKYKLRLLNASENEANLLGEREAVGPCSKEVEDQTPNQITITIRPVNKGFLDVDSTLYGGWDPMWFNHRVERLERAKQP